MTHRVHASARVHTAAIFCVLFILEDRKNTCSTRTPDLADFFDTNADTRSVCGT